jgi:hypothetical protein
VPDRSRENAPTSPDTNVPPTFVDPVSRQFTLPGEPVIPDLVCRVALTTRVDERGQRKRAAGLSIRLCNIRRRRSERSLADPNHGLANSYQRIAQTTLRKIRATR